MNRYFTTNVLRMFQNRKIYICTLGMALTLYMSGIAFIRSNGDSANLQDAFSVVSSSGFIILFYLLCVIFLQPLAAVQACLAVWHCMNCS